MRLQLLLTLAFACPAAAQFSASRPLIAESDSAPLQGIPHDAMWTSQFFIGEGSAFITPVDGGYLDTVTHHHVRWDAGTRQYRGLDGYNWRIQPLSAQRLLMERDLARGQRTWVRVVEWDGREMHLFDLETDEDSAFARHLRRQGISLHDGEVSGSPSSIREALRTLPLPAPTLDRRFRRPSHSEMGEIWNHFEITRWVEQQNELLKEVHGAESRLQRLGDLHKAHVFVSNAHYPQLATLDVLDFDAFEYAPLHPGHLKSLADRCSATLERLDARIKTRMAWMSEQVTVVEHIQKVDDPDDPWDYVMRPRPGALLKFHMVVKDANGREIENTRAKKEPAVAAIMGDLPEGLQYALRTVAYEEKLTLEIPPQLAFGEQFGRVTVEVEIVERLRTPLERPQLEDGLGYSIGPVDAEETPSGLRYRELSPGEGDSPARDDKVRIRTRAWNAVGTEVGATGEETVTVGSSTMLAGVTEALLSMKPGGQRLLYVPAHLADTRPERQGMAQCIAIELVALVD